MDTLPIVLGFEKIDKEDLPLVGGKGANLGELTRAGFPVPKGFAVTTNAYDLFLKENNLETFLEDVLKIDVHNPIQLESTAKAINDRFEKAEIPDIVAKEVFKAYKSLSNSFFNPLVAVRSSATAEDLPNASFAGQQATYLNIKGEATLLEKVKKCWISLFTPRAIFYRVENKIPHKKVKISVLVQKMVQSDVSGVMFTIDPINTDKDKIVIEAVWGLGETIVQGTVVPDRYIVQKETFDILSKEVTDQLIELKRVGSETKIFNVPLRRVSQQKLEDKKIIELAKIGQKIQEHYFFPQDIEWAQEKGNLYIVQTRPVTTIEKTKRVQSLNVASPVGKTPLLVGIPASPGQSTGMVKIVKSLRDLKEVKEGDVLVAKMTSPDYVPAMRKAVAIVTDEGGQTSHAAIVSREMGIPAVVGTQKATKVLKDRMLILVDGSTGQVFMGSEIKKTVKSTASILGTNLKTATKVYVNLGEPENARQISKRGVDGVGLLRAEFMMAQIGFHPKEAISQKKQGDYIKLLSSGIMKICRAFDGKPVVYRASDLKTNEYRALIGGKKWEIDEPNPMLGFRGALRYIKDPEIFTLELKALKKVRERYKNLWLMIPFVRTPEELKRIKKIVAVEGFFDEPSFKFWMMVELPVNVILIDEFLDVGIDGVSIGSNDLTMLLLGADRDNPQLEESFDERSKALLWSVKRVIKKCKKRDVTVSICGQAPSNYEDLVRFLVKAGIDSISVNPDAIEKTRQVVYEAEKELIKK